MPAVSRSGANCAPGGPPHFDLNARTLGFVNVPCGKFVHLARISTLVEMQRTLNNSNLVQRALGRWT